MSAQTAGTEFYELIVHMPRHSPNDQSEAPAFDTFAEGVAALTAEVAEYADHGYRIVMGSLASGFVIVADADDREMVLEVVRA